MPWRVSSIMSARHEFVILASHPDANIRALCRRFGISSVTAYKWLERFQNEGVPGLADRSRRPHHSPRQTAPLLADKVLALRRQHPAWGGRKLRQRLLDLGQPQLPSASTISAILKRHQMIDAAEATKHQAFLRFEHAAPNDLWQMDFKGDFAVGSGRCYPLTMLDDHSRFALALLACPKISTELARSLLTTVFRRYGLPRRITCDNGPPWGASNSKYTKLAVWLLRLGIAVSHSRPHHPQTQGKDERFHRSLQAEVLRYLEAPDLASWQDHFDKWRHVYNTERPHEALGLKVPATRYQPSQRSYPERLPAIEYGPDDLVRKVRGYGHIKYKSREYHIGSAFAGLSIALRFTTTDGLLDVYFCQHRIGQINLTV
jgi:transposase InsO family protein